VHESVVVSASQPLESSLLQVDFRWSSDDFAAEVGIFVSALFVEGRLVGCAVDRDVFESDSFAVDGRDCSCRRLVLGILDAPDCDVAQVSTSVYSSCYPVSILSCSCDIDVVSEPHWVVEFEGILVVNLDWPAVSGAGYVLHGIPFDHLDVPVLVCVDIGDDGLCERECFIVDGQPLDRDSLALVQVDHLGSDFADEFHSREVDFNIFDVVEFEVDDVFWSQCVCAFRDDYFLVPLSQFGVDMLDGIEGDCCRGQQGQGGDG